MLTKLVPVDEALTEGSPFSEDEVQFNLFHRISETPDSICLKTLDGKLIFAQTPGHNPWLWISKEILGEERRQLILALLGKLEKASLPGITSDPETARQFADTLGKPYDSFMKMESYFCPKVIKPLNVSGEIQKSTINDAKVVAEYLAGFLQDAFGTTVDPGSQYDKAESMIEAGGVYLWLVDEEPVSMANISHRSPRHARINSVFTPVQKRKKGYASALVAEICSILEGENLVPMLYADLQNPDSNKVYQNIGFIKSGIIEELKGNIFPVR